MTSCHDYPLTSSAPPPQGVDKYIEQIKQTTNNKYHQKPFHDSEKNDSTKIMASQDP
jgi:hypothetical protein